MPELPPFTRATLLFRLEIPAIIYFGSSYSDLAGAPQFHGKPSFHGRALSVPSKPCLHLSCPDQQKRTTKQAAAQGSGSFKESNAYLVPKSMSVIDCPEPPAIARATRRTPSDDRDPRGWHTPGLSPPATLHHWDRYYSGR